MDIKDIKSPADIKGLDIMQLEDVALQLRAVLLKKLGAHGGHVGPNLGALEAIVALHYVFDAPTDKLVFDVSHQTYVHKMLTGRIEAFLDPADYDKVSGYTDPGENPDYDLFEIGHTSTSIALASGIAKARDMQGGKENVVAFIGDGSLSGGLAFEGLDFGATLGTNFIVVVNDNQMSIAENHGGLYPHLQRLRESDGTASDNVFRAMGYDYLYVRDGNSLPQLVEAFRGVKDSSKPVVVHINTMKGNGLPVAERNKEMFHYHAPFDLKTGDPLVFDNSIDYSDIFSRHMLQRMSEDSRIAVITAGTPGVLGFTPEQRHAAGRQFVDVGIAEQQAVSMAAGIARQGGRPVFGVVSTFLQRAYDQMSHDVALNRLPVVLVTFYNGVFGLSDKTHLGIFDTALISNIPGLLYLAPTCKEEYLAMLDWAVKQTDRPVAIRTPGGPVRESSVDVPSDYSNVGYQIVEQGERVAIIAASSMFENGSKACVMLREKGYRPTLINPRVLSYIDTACLDRLKDYELVVTMEDSILNGGMGQKIAAYLAETPVKVKCLGLANEFLDRYDAQAILTQNGLQPAQVSDYVAHTLTR